MTDHPNTVAYSAGAVCCPDGPSAERHSRRGDRATWTQPQTVPRIDQHGHDDYPEARRWTR